MKQKQFIAVLVLSLCLVLVLAAAAQPLLALSMSEGLRPADPRATLDVGLAKIDITPATQIRLSGYAIRSSESVGVQQRLWAKAIAIGRGKNTCVLVTADCTGLSRDMTDRMKRLLFEKTKIPPDRVVVAASHTHSAPMISGYLENLFGARKHSVTAEQQARIDRYTPELEKKLLQTALEAVNRPLPSLLFWGQGTAGFARNRRTEDGPVDHGLPVLKVADPNGGVRAVVVGYACHGTTLDPADNLVSGDWIGYAEHYIEERFPGSVAMVVIGAGADSNPHPRGALAHAQQHGQEVADEVEQILSQGILTPIGGCSVARMGTIELDFVKDGVKPLPYTVQTWVFGNALALVFLEGEVVVDYSLRLKQYFYHRLSDDRLWVNAFCNSVPGYIPSERILKEGGYEADGSTFYYGLPGRFGAGLEDKIIEEVLGQLQSFLEADMTREGKPEDSHRKIPNQKHGL